MRAWEGMERFLQLSLGSQVGASGVAMIAVIELKQRVQQQVKQGSAESKSVRLTAEEWRSIAGIHVRKTFERTKAMLEKLGVLQIRQDGKLLEITLWPKARPKPDDPTFKGTTLVSEHETGRGTDTGTNTGTDTETDVGTDRGTVLASLSEHNLRSREDEVFPRPDVTKNVISVRDNSLRRYPLIRYPLIQHSNNINVSNETTNNAQRSNEQRTEEVSLVEFATLWVQETGHPLTPYEKAGLVRFMRLGYTEELFVEALRCAVAADNRRMGYVLGILRNWYQEGVRCLQDVAEVKAHWEDLRFVKRAKSG